MKPDPKLTPKAAMLRELDEQRKRIELRLGEVELERARVEGELDAILHLRARLAADQVPGMAEEDQ